MQEKPLDLEEAKKFFDEHWATVTVEEFNRQAYKSSHGKVGWSPEEWDALPVEFKEELERQNVEARSKKTSGNP